MQSRFEQQQPLSNSGFVHSDALEQHVGKRVKTDSSGAHARKGGEPGASAPKRGDETGSPPSQR